MGVFTEGRNLLEHSGIILYKGVSVSRNRTDVRKTLTQIKKYVSIESENSTDFGHRTRGEIYVSCIRCVQVYH